MIPPCPADWLTIATLVLFCCVCLVSLYAASLWASTCLPVSNPPSAHHPLSSSLAPSIPRFLSLCVRCCTCTSPSTRAEACFGSGTCGGPLGVVASCFLPFLSFPFLSFPFLSVSFLSFPFLSFPFRSFPFLSFPLLEGLIRLLEDVSHCLLAVSLTVYFCPCAHPHSSRSLPHRMPHEHTRLSGHPLPPSCKCDCSQNVPCSAPPRITRLLHCALCCYYLTYRRVFCSFVTASRATAAFTLEC